MTRVLGFLLGSALLLVVVWGETVGIVHSFRQHGIGHGIASIAIPPYAWWRGIEFFYHPRRLAMAEFKRRYHAILVAQGHMRLGGDDVVLIDSERATAVWDSLVGVYGAPARREPPADPCERYRLSTAAQAASESLIVAWWGPRDASGLRPLMQSLSNDEKLAEMVRLQAVFDSMLEARCAQLR